MGKKKAPVHARLENERQEQFARCIAVGNFPAVCAIGTGYADDPDAAFTLADSPTMRKRAEEIFRQVKPYQYRANGYTHVTDR